MEQLTSYWIMPGLFNKMTSDNIMDHVCNRLCIARNLLLAKTRKRHVVDARRICIYLIKQNNPNLTLSNLGNLFNLNHATISHALKTHSSLIKSDKDYRNKVQNVHREPITLIS